MRYIVVLVLVLIFSCKKNNYKNEIIISETIKADVEKLVSDVLPHDDNELPRAYENRIFINYYENDTLLINKYEGGVPMLLSSAHYKKNDTIYLVGEYGTFGGVGYRVKFHNDKAMVSFRTITDGVSKYTLDAEDTTTVDGYVQVKNYNLTLSNYPRGANDELIYGLIELETSDFYRKDFDNSNVKKAKTKLKIYFKSYFFDTTFKGF